MVGIHNLYWYYGSQIYYVVKEGNRKLIHTSEAFQGMPRTLLSLFWSMFGLIGVDSVEIKYPKKERGDKYLSSFPGGNHATSIVEGVGQFLFALYHVAIIIVLTNMLIAMMSHSFEAIQGDCDVEWKFARTRLWVNYIDEGSTLPVPFNMIPTPKSLVYIWIWIKDLFKSKDKNLEKTNEITKRQTFIKSRREMVCQSLSLDSPETNYSDILQRLVRRYLFKLERQKEEGKDKAGIGSDGQTLQGQPSPESFNQPEPAYADDTDDQDSNACTSYDYQQDNSTKQLNQQQQQQPSNPPRYESIQPRFYEAKLGNRDSSGKMNVGFNLPESKESGKQNYPHNPPRTFKSSLSRNRFGGHSQYRSGRRPSLLPGSSGIPGGGGSSSAAAVVQLISLPQIDAIQRSLKLLDVRLQHVQSAAREETHSRKDIDHIRTVMSENQKALSTVVTVLSSIQEEVRGLSVAFSRQQQLQILPPLVRKRSNETKHQQIASSSSSTKLLLSPAPISPTSPYYVNPFTLSSPISPTQTTLSVTSTSGYAMLPREFRRLDTKTENSLL